MKDWWHCLDFLLGGKQVKETIYHATFYLKSGNQVTLTGLKDFEVKYASDGKLTSWTLEFHTFSEHYGGINKIDIDQVEAVACMKAPQY